MFGRKKSHTDVDIKQLFLLNEYRRKEIEKLQEALREERDYRRTDINAINALLEELALSLGFKRNFHSAVTLEKWVIDDLDRTKDVPAVVTPAGRLRVDYEREQS